MEEMNLAERRHGSERALNVTVRGLLSGHSVVREGYWLKPVSCPKVSRQSSPVKLSGEAKGRLGGGHGRRPTEPGVASGPLR